MPRRDAHPLSVLFVAPALQGQGIGTRAVRFPERTYPAARTWALCTPYLNRRVSAALDAATHCSLSCLAPLLLVESATIAMKRQGRPGPWN